MRFYTLLIITVSAILINKGNQSVGYVERSQSELNELINNQTLYYVSKRGSSDIFVFEKGERRQLTNNSADNRTPRVSPDGTKILFDSETNGRNYDLYLMDIDGKNPEKITNHPKSELGASWGVDSNTIFFESDRDGDFDLYMMKLDSKEITQLTTHPADDFRPVVSPDGNMLVFTSERDRNEELYVLNLKDVSKSERRLTEARGRDSWASFSKDGEKIVFHSERTGQSEIWEMDADGSNQSQITDFPKNGDAFFPWYVETDEGRAILYSSEKNDHYDWDIWMYKYQDKDALPVKIIDSEYRDFRAFVKN